MESHTKINFNNLLNIGGSFNRVGFINAISPDSSGSYCADDKYGGNQKGLLVTLKLNSINEYEYHSHIMGNTNSNTNSRLGEELLLMQQAYYGCDRISKKSPSSR